MVLGGDGVVCEWNPAAEQLLGLARLQAVGAPARQILSPEHRERFDAIWLDLRGAQVAPSFDARWRRRDGSWSTIAVTVAPIRAAGSLAGAVAILRDVSVGDSWSATDGSVLTGATVRAPGAGGALTLGVLERDELTGLPGRRWIQRRLAEPAPPRLARGVAVLDVDAFALINQTYGPDAADDVLTELARRLGRAQGPGVLGRWQADTFVWVVDVQDPTASSATPAWWRCWARPWLTAAARRPRSSWR